MSSDPYDRAESLPIARRAVAAGAEEAMAAFRTEFGVSEKRDAMDVVTDADVTAQAAVAASLRGALDAPTIVGEEDEIPSSVPDSGAAWIVDPIDGTNNYARGNRLWATVVSKVEDGEPVASVTAVPAVGDTYAAGSGVTTRNEEPATVSGVGKVENLIVGTIYSLVREDRDAHSALGRGVTDAFGDLRRLGAGQVTLAKVATGEYDAAVAVSPQSPWDSVAGAHLVRAAGGTVTDLSGRRFRHDSDTMVATNGRAHEDVLAVLADVLDR